MAAASCITSSRTTTLWAKVINLSKKKLRFSRSHFCLLGTCGCTIPIGSLHVRKQAPHHWFTSVVCTLPKMVCTKGHALFKCPGFLPTPHPSTKRGPKWNLFQRKTNRRNSGQFAESFGSCNGDKYLPPSTCRSGVVLLFALSDSGLGTGSHQWCRDAPLHRITH